MLCACARFEAGVLVPASAAAIGAVEPWCPGGVATVLGRVLPWSLGVHRPDAVVPQGSAGIAALKMRVVFFPLLFGFTVGCFRLGSQSCFPA